MRLPSGTAAYLLGEDLELGLTLRLVGRDLRLRLRLGLLQPHHLLCERGGHRAGAQRRQLAGEHDGVREEHLERVRERGEGRGSLAPSFACFTISVASCSAVRSFWMPACACTRDRRSITRWYLRG